ncbi:MAG: helix-turn-helix transcriptional regulator [Candidatus Cloacimonetes bacterium]|nr:helix-turn-helix transcriptional regulator [Candidatus Cloacimonadota bacterium]
MYDTRKTLQLTQEKLSELTGIAQSALSRLERGKYNPNQTTRDRIEAVIGKVDWIENEKIKLRKSSYFKAERLLKKIVELTLTMEATQKEEFKQLIFKYFK